jgi:DNA polymerase-1
VANADLALLSKKLATIVRDMPLTEDWRQSKPETGAALAAFFTQMDFRSLLARLTVNGTEAPVPAEQELAPLQWQQEQAALAWLAQEQEVAVWPLWNGPCLSGLVLSDGSEVCLFAAECATWDTLLTNLGNKKNVIGHDMKRLVRWLLQERQTEFSVSFDTALAAYLLDATQGEASFASICLRYLGREESLASLPEQDAAAYGAKALLELHPVLEAQLDAQHMRALYFSLELPLVRVLAVMEAQGIAVDWLHLQAVNEELGQRIQELLTGIHAAAGEEFNVNSTKQLGVVLFEKLGLPVQKKTKTGYSTDAEVLEKLSGHHAVVDQLLEYRMLSKLKSTYLEGLSVLINRQNNRVYTHFNQMVTSTGRLSSSEPNLQNIPVRTETGRRIRELFVPGEGYAWLMSADYSQIELRVLAHMSGDESFIDAFLKNQDIHARTAAEVFGVAMADVTSELRRRAKAVNFGIVYGISDYGLARDLGVSRNEAAAYIEGYFARYPKVKTFMENAVAQARKDGYAETMLGRRRYLTDINSRNFNQRSFAERTAMNTPIQGSAADIIKKAMLLVFEALQEKKLHSRLLLQVHDELVLEVTEEERNLVTALVKEKMEQAVCLQVPLLVDVHCGANWAQAK